MWGRLLHSANNAPGREPLTPASDGASSPDQGLHPLIRKHLDDVLRSPEFVRSSRLSQLLRFAVEQRLAGTDVTERLLAEKVFQKSEDWDPKVDPAVRMAFSRLRLKLKGFYETAGQSNAVRVDLPLGTYNPEIAASEREPETPPAPRAPKRPRVLSLLAAATAGLILLASLGALAIRQFEPAAAAAHDFSVVPIATQLGGEVSPDISPNAKQVGG